MCVCLYQILATISSSFLFFVKVSSILFQNKKKTISIVPFTARFNLLLSLLRRTEEGGGGGGKKPDFFGVKKTQPSLNSIIPGADSVHNQVWGATTAVTVLAHCFPFFFFF